MVRQQSHRTLSQTVGSVLRSITSNRPVVWDTIPESIREVVESQETVGWDNFVFRCWSIEWWDSLERTDTHTTGCSQRLVAAMIERLWETSGDLRLGRNAAVYRHQELLAKGEIIEIHITATRLCRKLRWRRQEAAGRACMAN
jgi:hypothetical protein